MIVPTKLNKNELNGLNWTLPKIEQDKMLVVLKTRYTYINRYNQLTQIFSNYRKRSNIELEANEEEIEIHMAIIENLNVDKQKILLNNREKNYRVNT